MITIPQGKPNSGRFKLFVPVTQYVHVGDEVICQHPTSGVKTAGEVYGIITEPWLRIPDWICLDTYGVDSLTLKNSLEEKFPDHRGQDNVKILLIKQK